MKQERRSIMKYFACVGAYIGAGFILQELDQNLAETNTTENALEKTPNTAFKDGELPLVLGGIGAIAEAKRLIDFFSKKTPEP